MTQSTPSATLNDLATAAVVAYNTGKSGEPAMGSQWTQISQAKILEKLPSSLSQGDIDAKGFSGQLYVNQQTGEVIIADRGTIANVQNIISDVQISVGARQ